MSVFWTWNQGAERASPRGMGKAIGPFRRAPGGGPFFAARERCEQQLKKTGGTPFRVEGVSVPEEGVPCGVSVLNALRREALEQLLRLRERRGPIPFSKGELFFSPAPRARGSCPCAPISERPLKCARRQGTAGKLCCPWKRRLKSCSVCGKRDSCPFFLDTPRGLFGEENRTVKQMKERMQAGFLDFVAGNLGAVALGRDLGARVHGSFSLNVFNTAALDFFQKLAFPRRSSPWTHGGEVSRLGGELPRGLMVYGRQALMLTRNCPLANSPKGCLHCKEPGYLTDRKRKKFPVVCRGGQKR